MPSGVADDLRREAQLYRAQQMAELPTRKAQAAAAAASGVGAVEQLRSFLGSHWVRVIDLLHEWDEDDSGYVDKREFRKALPALGLAVDKAQIDQIFDTLDADGSGQLSLEELNRALRPGANVELDAALHAGAMGTIELGRENQIGLRTGLGGNTSHLVGMSLSADSKVPLHIQIQQALGKNYARIIDVFREWDEDGSGTVSRKEFRQALPLFGLRLERAQADELFDGFDDDGSGELDYAELRHKLRKAGGGAAGAARNRAKARAALARARSDGSLPPASNAAGSDEERVTSAVPHSRTERLARHGEMAALRDAEAVARQKLVRVQRELARASSEAAVAETRLKKRAVRAPPSVSPYESCDHRGLLPRMLRHSRCQSDASFSAIADGCWCAVCGAPAQVTVGMKIEQDKRVGRDLSQRFAAVQPAPPEAVQLLSEQLNVSVASRATQVLLPRQRWAMPSTRPDPDSSHAAGAACDIAGRGAAERPRACRLVHNVQTDGRRWVGPHLVR